MEHYEGYRPSGLKPGDRLPETGAIVVASTMVKKDASSMEHGYVLCILPDNEVTPWVSWCFNTNRELQSTALPEPTPSCYWGDYAYTWLEATAGFAKRIIGWQIDHAFRQVCYVEEGDVPSRHLEGAM